MNKNIDKKTEPLPNAKTDCRRLSAFSLLDAPRQIPTFQASDTCYHPEFSIIPAASTFGAYHHYYQGVKQRPSTGKAFSINSRRKVIFKTKGRYLERQKVKIHFLPRSTDYFYANANCPCPRCRAPCIICELGDVCEAQQANFLVGSALD